jgi:hypothetical protein
MRGGPSKPGVQMVLLVGLAGEVPDHSTFSKNRHGRFRDSDLLPHVFETVAHRCMAERLLGGAGFTVDASLINADANRQRGLEGSQGLAPEMSSRAIDEYMAELDNAAFGAATEVTPIRRRAGRAPTAGRPSSPIPPTTSSIWITRLLSMRKPRPRFARPK